MNKIIKILLIFILLILLIGCQKKNIDKNNSQIIPVQLKPHLTTLYFTGTIQPLKTIAVTSPVLGVVAQSNVQYGEWVKAGSLLFKISSNKFLSDYKTAFMQYIKAKSEYDNSEIQLKESTFLYQHQLISKDEFKNKQSNYFMNQLALFQAKENLSIFIKKLNIQEKNIYELKISDINKISNILNINNNYLNIFSPLSGVILSAKKPEEEKKKMIAGDVVKEDEVLAMVGDISGITVKIKINELTVNQLHIHQTVKITGLAFPDELNGTITRIDYQGESSSFGQPVFTAEAVVPNLTVSQKKNIHIGMSAKIEINIQDKPAIVIPFSALIEKNNRYFVLAYHQLNNKKILKEIQIKKTTPDKIIVLSGLTPGETIIDSH